MLFTNVKLLSKWIRLSTVIRMRKLMIALSYAVPILMAIGVIALMI